MAVQMSAKETVKLDLLDCMLWQTGGMELKDAVREKGHWGDMPFSLGWMGGAKRSDGESNRRGDTYLVS